MKKYFVTGLVILLPLALTFVVVMFLINLLTGPFVGIVSEIFKHYGLFEKGILFLSAAQVNQIASQMLILTLIFFATVLLGMIAKWFFIHYLLRLNDYIFQKIPVVRSIYRTSKDVIQTIFASKTASFKQVVLVPFPTKKSHCLGFLTKDHFPGQENLVAVFVPTAPNPTSGYLILYRKEDISFVDIPIEDAFKCIVSCGVILSPFHHSGEKAKKVHEKSLKETQTQA